jgi:hypothetical protein
MSSRLVRRRQEQAAAGAIGGGSAESSEEDDDGYVSSRRPPANFSLLEDDEEEDGEEEDTDRDEAPAPSLAPAMLSNRERRAQQKLKKDQGQTEDLLLQPAPTAAAATSTSGATASTSPAEEETPPLDPWRLSPVHADVSNELARIFGRQALRAANAEQRRDRPPQHGRDGYEAAAARLRERGGGGGRGRLIKPRDTWPPFSGGLGMEVDHFAAAPGEDVTGASASAPAAQRFVFTHSAAYRTAQRDLDEAVEVGDPRALQAIVQYHPYQVEALLRLSDYCALAGQREQSTELCERALYACEQALHPMCRLLEGSCRLRYSEPANRPFFLALHRHMIASGRRGCSRTALELGRLLLSLDPQADPMHTLLHLDFYALSVATASTDPARQSSGDAAAEGEQCVRWLIGLAHSQLPGHSLPLYPNYAFSLALAKRWLYERVRDRHRRLDETDEQLSAARAVEEDTGGAASMQLRRALLLFPAALPLLLECTEAGAAGGTNANLNPAAVTLAARWHAIHGDASCEANCGATLRKLLMLYCRKASSLWALRRYREWLVAEASALCGHLEAVAQSRPAAAAAAATGSTTEVAEMAQGAEVGRLWRDARAATTAEYVECASSRHDEFASADPADFPPTPPDALPPEQLENLEAAADLGVAARQWVRARQMPHQLRPHGRLVLPREEWVVIDRTMHPVLKFFYSLLPWVVAPPAPRGGGAQPR